MLRPATSGSAVAPVWKSTSASGARACWLGRAVRNRHRHAIEQASRRWRGGRRDDSARTRRKILIFTRAPALRRPPDLPPELSRALVAAQRRRRSIFAPEDLSRRRAAPRALDRAAGAVPPDPPPRPAAPVGRLRHLHQSHHEAEPLAPRARAPVRLHECRRGAPACVEIKILRRVRAESSRRPPRHRRDACSVAWRCRFLAARPSQDGSAIAET